MSVCTPKRSDCPPSINPQRLAYYMPFRETFADVDYKALKACLSIIAQPR